jgi:hypothetical protein
MIKLQRSGFALTMLCVALTSFGLTMLLMSVIYMRDLAFLVNAPLVVWSAICGQPSNDPLTLPILVTLGSAALLIGIVLIVVIAVGRARPSLKDT